MSAELPKSERARIMSELDPQRRVEELTAELGKAKARSQHNYECANTQAKRANDAEEKLCSANRRWQELYDENQQLESRIHALTAELEQSKVFYGVTLRQRDTANAELARLREEMFAVQIELGKTQAALAPERGTRDVVDTAIDLTKDDKRSRWNALMARTAELPVTVMATSKYPTPAPCSGCASARELLQKIAARKECHREVLGWLKEHGNG